MKTWLVKLFEAVFVIGLVLAFFLGILALLPLLFPSGTPLREIVAPLEPASRVEGRRHLAQDRAWQTEELEPLTATLIEVYNTVKRKPADAIAWSPANRGLALYSRDAVQTLGHSRARIRFDQHSHLDLGENSLIIIREFGQVAARREKRSTLVLMDGILRGRAVAAQGELLRMDVEMPNARAVITQPAGVAQGEDAFLVTVNPDKSSTIAVYQGKAEVSAQGKTVQVAENQSTTVAPDQAPEPPRPLPASPQSLAPEDGRSFAFRQLSPKVRFDWSMVPQADRYRLEVARDPGFKDVAVNEILSQPGFVHGNLRQGTYYWRVSGINGPAEGRPGPARRFALVRDAEPPLLQVEFPPAVVHGEDCTLRGVTAPGTRIFIGDQAVVPDAAGRFDHQLKLRRGLNVLVVEAVDATGNVSYQTGKVNGKF
ncbi:FecR family protein [Desulfuromonas versatilis]|uniref:FecR family protein n=1 Tax=Desulfuromonas versatilis TaxID=2802975 RepID=UPI001C843D70|nr:hypothetical protein [Desulfuromonas versatilis]